jgi:competence protein ComEC
VKLLKAAIPFTLGIALGRMLVAPPSTTEMIVVAVAGAMIVFTALFAKRFAVPTVLMALLLLGLLRAAVGTDDLPVPWGDIPRNEERVSLRGVLLSDPVPAGERIRLRLDVQADETDASNESLNFVVDVYTDRLHDSSDSQRRSADFRYGDVYRVSGRFILTTDRDDVVGIVSTSSVELVRFGEGNPLRSFIADIRATISHTLTDSLDSKSGGLAAALLVGDRTKLQPETIDNFRASGLSHVLAISGLHIAMIGGFTIAVSVWVMGRRRQIYLLAPAVSVWVYSGLAGLTSSVKRAAIMFTVYILARLLGRQRSVIPALALAGAVMLALDPEIIGSISFQLSFAAVLGIALFSGRLASRVNDRIVEYSKLPKLLKRPITGVIYGSAVSLAATIATAPFVAFHFGEIPIWGIPITLLIVPALPLLIGVSALVAVVGLAPVDSIAIAGLAAHALGNYMSFISQMFASLPGGPLEAEGSSVPLIAGWYGVLFALLNRERAKVMANRVTNLMQNFRQQRDISVGAHRDLHVPNRRRINAALPIIAIWIVAAISLVGFVASAPTSTDLTATFFETNRGDMIFIERPSGTRLLIDAGDDSDLAIRNIESVLPPLDRRIDVILSTHPYADHLGGLQRIVEQFEVETIIDAGVAHDSNIYESWVQSLAGDERVVTAQVGLVIALDTEVSLSILQTRCVVVDCSNFNDEGVVARRDFGDVSFLLTGDMTSGSEADALQTGQPVKSTVLKVGHHGSRTSTTQSFLDAVDPELAIVTTGIKNQFGHPQKDVIARLEDQLSSESVYVTRDR